MASILGIELDDYRSPPVQVGDVKLFVGVYDNMRLGVREWHAWIRAYDDGDPEPILDVSTTKHDRDEAIAALEAKVKRLPGVLAVLNGGE